MKKILSRLALLLVPFILYAGFFFYFEPYDYFGLKGGTVNEDSMLVRVKEYLDHPADCILLGDSRMAHFDIDEVSRLTGKRTANLAFGGASLNESIALFQTALEANPDLETCYFEVSFYNLRRGDERNRTDAIKTLLKNPFAYFFNFNFNMDMLNEAQQRLRGIQTGATRDAGAWLPEDYLDANGAPLPYRANLMTYADTIRGQCEQYQLNTENLSKLTEIAKTCAENGIRLIFVFPPVDTSITDLVILPLDLTAPLAEIKATLAATGAEIRDFEFVPEVNFTENQFYDGFHLDVVTGLPAYTEILFGSAD